MYLSLLRSFSHVAFLFLCSLRRWKVYADAGWFLDLPSFTDPAQRPMRAIAQALQLGYNATFDATCISQLEPGQVGRCLPPPSLSFPPFHDRSRLGAAGLSQLEPSEREALSPRPYTLCSFICVHM